MIVTTWPYILYVHMHYTHIHIPRLCANAPLYIIGFTKLGVINHFLLPLLALQLSIYPKQNYPGCHADSYCPDHG